MFLHLICASMVQMIIYLMTTPSGFYPIVCGYGMHISPAGILVGKNLYPAGRAGTGAVTCYPYPLTRG